ncbi:MAG: hypothetical protein JW827_02515 [Spirochaetes bacterium]|nr:hypothetical protein [Spirochaetota bacterium]
MSENKKVLIITQNKRLLQALTNIIKNKDCSLVSGYPGLNDISLMKLQIKIKKNTSFIRTSFNQFIKDNGGPPVTIVLDYRMDLGLDDSLDPDKKKLFRTFIISSILLSRANTFGTYNTISMIFVGGPGDVKHFKAFKQYPNIVFKTVRTNNQQINDILDYYITHPEEANKIFYFNYLIINESNDVIEPSKKFEKILDKVLSYQEKIVYKEKVKDQTPIMDGKYEPAKVVFKYSNSYVYLDGKTMNIENNQTYQQYKVNTVYIDGYYVNSTLQEVNRKLEKFFLEDLPKIRKVTPEDRIELDLNHHSIIDGATTHALNILVSFKLHEYKNIEILTNNENYRKMEKSPGFISLRKHIIKRLFDKAENNDQDE